ncbi:MAG: S1/P1 Nuclease [Caulobacteraceae bacterium]
MTHFASVLRRLRKALQRCFGPMTRLPTAALAAFAAFFLASPAALAWGSSGHRIIGRVAVGALPADLPAFIRSKEAIAKVGELSREPDRWKGAGKTHDADLSPAHYVDVDDRARVLGGPALTDLPDTRGAYERDLRRVGADGWRAGYLPYSIVETWQQLAFDFAYWRADAAGARMDPDPAHRSWLAADEAEREALTLRDLGVLSHYVGDGSQPLHVIWHFNGWGPHPNPEGFTNDPIHIPFEGPFVRSFVTPQMVEARLSPYRADPRPILKRVEAYLLATNREVVPLYRLWKAGGFAPGDPKADLRGEAFAADRLADGASELRDLVVDAWKKSEDDEVGWPAVPVKAIEAGKIDPYDSLYGTD